MSAKVKILTNIFNDISERIYGDNTDSHADCTHREEREPQRSPTTCFVTQVKLLKPL